MQQALLLCKIVATSPAADPGVLAAGQLRHTRDQLQHSMHLMYASLCSANNMGLNPLQCI